jgi:hypothetical protein
VLGRPPAQLAEDGTASRELQGWRPQRSPRWSELVKPIGRYCQNLLKLLQSVTEAEMCSWVLRAVSSALPLIVATPRLSVSAHAAVPLSVCPQTSSCRGGGGADHVCVWPADCCR